MWIWTPPPAPDRHSRQDETRTDGRVDQPTKQKGKRTPAEQPSQHHHSDHEEPALPGEKPAEAAAVAPALNALHDPGGRAVQDIPGLDPPQENSRAGRRKCTTGTCGRHPEHSYQKQGAAHGGPEHRRREEVGSPGSPGHRNPMPPLRHRHLRLIRSIPPALAPPAPPPCECAPYWSELTTRYLPADDSKRPQLPRPPGILLGVEEAGNSGAGTA
jgi:hypothetical protein